MSISLSGTGVDSTPLIAYLPHCPSAVLYNITHTHTHGSYHPPPQLCFPLTCGWTHSPTHYIFTSCIEVFRWRTHFEQQNVTKTHVIAVLFRGSCCFPCSPFIKWVSLLCLWSLILPWTLHQTGSERLLDSNTRENTEVPLMSNNDTFPCRSQQLSLLFADSTGA